MKKILHVLTIISLIFMFVGCSTNKGDTPNAPSGSPATTTDSAIGEGEDGSESEEKPNPSSDSKYPFPDNAEVKGEKGLLITTDSGDSDDGNVPVMFVESDAIIVQIGLDLGDPEDDPDKNWDGDKEVFVYINKIFVQAEQAGGYMQTSIDLQDDMLKPGTYTVTAVQYEDNDPNSEVLNLSEAQFEIKEGH